MTRLFFIFCACLGAWSAFAQDPHFSQFYNAPLMVNPARTGDINGNLRVVLNHRNQWSSVASPFVTSAASVDVKVFKERFKGNSLGLGLSVLTDESGTIKLGYSKAMFSSAYHHLLSKRSTLSIGAQAGIFQKGFDPKELIFSSQFSGTDFDPTISSGEINLNNRVTKLDLQAGLFFSHAASDEQTWFGGISFFHVTQPDQSFFQAAERLSMLSMVQVGGDLKVGDQPFYLVPQLLMVIQNGDREMIAGCNLDYTLESDALNNVRLLGGLWYRWADAAVLYTGLGYKKWQMGFSYDINVSTLKPASQYRGGFELSLIYVDKILPGKQKLIDALPCKRY